ncbi:tyrosinase family protein [Pinirhizobacter sp.]|jgi:hypothetical protein|uniref:tyrosinase family protein n=1 Tax=Pinirhizobacter sp. TaxID=2950432 RepID=UPI002F413E3C
MDANGNDNRDSRRKFLTHGATLLAAGAALPALPALAGHLRGSRAAEPAGLSTLSTVERRNVNGAYSTAVLGDLRAAINAMMALPPEDPRNWYRQAMIHVLDCPHGNAWFFPWHRGYLYWFECIARKLLMKPSFALPYWDWTSASDMPAAFFRGDLLDTRATGFIHDFPTFNDKFRGPMETFWSKLNNNQRNALNQRGMDTFEKFWSAVHIYFSRGTGRKFGPDNRGLTGDALEAVSLPILTNALAPSTFEEFGGSMVDQHNAMGGSPGMVESQPHNLVHEAIGGYMGDFMSAADPVFWLHHCNIDRLWDIWMERKGWHGQDGSAAWRNEPFLFFSDENGEAVNGITRDYVSSSELSFAFEASAPIPSAPARPGNAAWPAMIPCTLQSSDLKIDGAVTASVDPGLAACDAFRNNCQTALLIDMDRPDDQNNWRFTIEVKVDGGAPYTFKHCGRTGFFGTMGAMGPGRLHRGQLKVGIASGISNCLTEAGPGAHKFTVRVRAKSVGNSSSAAVLKVYKVTLVSV